jgi:hypothetical protein
MRTLMAQLAQWLWGPPGVADPDEGSRRLERAREAVPAKVEELRKLNREAERTIHLQKQEIAALAALVTLEQRRAEGAPERGRE